MTMAPSSSRSSQGLVVTTNPGGAGKFTADLAVFLTGRRVVALEDNDEAGAAHVVKVLEAVEGVAAQAAALKLPGLGPKGDVSDWLDSTSSINRNSVFDLETLAERALNPPDDVFEMADLELWSRVAPTPKAFIMAPYIPREEVVIVTGDGGTNKSTLALQISVATASGKQMLGMDVAPGPALYVTAEDDQRENHWRLDKIAKALDTSIGDLAGRLHIVSLRGRLHNELATFDNEGKLRPAPAYKTLRATIKQTGAKLVTLDNVAHLFAGNENDRSNVTAFINLLYQICNDFGVTILLIAHRNRDINHISTLLTFDRLLPMGDNRLALLTDREREVIRLIARNRGDGQIAELLHVSIHTVRTHIKNARGKVGGRDKYYLADALNDLEGRNPSLASLRNGIERDEPLPADEPVPAVGTVREERLSYHPDGHAALPSSTRRRWGDDNDIRTLTIICLVLAIAMLIAQAFIHERELADVFQDLAAHLHQID